MEKISKELADEIKKKIWQDFLDSGLEIDLAITFKIACDAVYSFVEVEAIEDAPK